MLVKEICECGKRVDWRTLWTGLEMKKKKKKQDVGLFNLLQFIGASKSMKSEWKTIGKFNPIRFTYNFFLLLLLLSNFFFLSMANILNWKLVDLLHIKYDSVIDFLSHTIFSLGNLTRKFYILPNWKLLKEIFHSFSSSFSSIVLALL